MHRGWLAGAAALAIGVAPVALSAQQAGQAGGNAGQRAPGAGGAPGAGAVQANSQARPGATTTTVTSGPAGPVVSTNNPGNLTPPPASALNKTYPVCSRSVQDNCRNPGGR